MTNSTDLPTLPPRPADSNKGTYGRVLIVAGSRGMSGAAALAGFGALRGGAGLVEIGVPAGIQSIVAGIEPCWMTTGLPEDGDGRLTDHALNAVEFRWKSASAVAIGPGWGVTAATRQLARSIVERCPHPLVVDADALNALADQPDVWRKAAAARVITPHPGELARLQNSTTSAVQSDRTGQAQKFAKTHGVVVLLKGHQTVIADGVKVAVNTTGNPGMATGGTGDVLTGLIAALLAQKMNAFDAARLAAHLHGLAGDLAAAEFSEPGLIASDVARYVGRAWRTLSHRA
jgi:NAD(P)H-hydrate epimerase